jgi:hypothetical protein
MVWKAETLYQRVLAIREKALDLTIGRDASVERDLAHGTFPRGQSDPLIAQGRAKNSVI